MKLSGDEVQGLINLQTHPENIRKPRCPLHPQRLFNTDLTYSRSYKTLYVTYIYDISQHVNRIYDIFLEKVTSYECENSEMMQSSESKVYFKSIISPVI